MPPSFASRSWFLNQLARRLGQAGRGRRALHVQTDPKSYHLGNFYHVVEGGMEPSLDLLACSPWGRLDPRDEDYGTDEPFLPPFYVVGLSFNRQNGWESPDDVASKIGGPLTVTLMCINLLGAERSFLAARDFERAMVDDGIVHHVSTQFINPGILASVTLMERTEPHQVLVASRVYAREPVANPEFGKVRD